MAAAILAASVPVAQAPRQPVTSRDLVEVADVGGLALSPDGRRVAYRIARPSIETNDVALDWYVADVLGGKPMRVGGGGAARHDGAGSVAEQTPVWDPDSRGLRYLALVDGAVAVWHWREGESARREIVDDADIVRFDLDPGGRSIRYTVGATRAEIAAAEKAAYDDGVLVDARLDLNQPLAGGMIEDGRRIMQRFPTDWFDRARILWDAPRSDKVVDLASGGIRAAQNVASEPQGKIERQAKLVRRSDGLTAAIDADGRPGITITRADGSRIECLAALCRSTQLAALEFVPGSDRLLIYERDGLSREIVWLYTPGARKARRLAVSDGAIRSPVRGPRCVAAEEAIVCAESAPVDPPRLVRLAYKNRAETIIDDPNSELRDRIAAIATRFTWPDGHEAILLRPRGARGAMPLVAHYAHCEGFLRGGVGGEIPMLPLVEHGIAVLCMNRTAPARGAPMEASYQVGLEAVTRAIDELAAKGLADPEHVGFGGLSFGSTVVLWAIRKSDRFAAATISSGQISSQYYWTNAVPDRGYTKMLQGFFGIGDPDSDPERWRVLTATADAEKIDTPLLIQAPESEIRNLVELHTRMKRAGRPIELYGFADEIHIKYQPVHKRAVYERNLDWYRFWLKGEEDDVPAKSAQYLRWRGYRAGQPLSAPVR
ncbi:Atxe2 family lasso peptide isopeptidase [Sphingopyxis sp. KK2]|uniref:Atxe2 family lasso peptide isopeptidase n=1 Tax=Sphingopyxis sp. KK2 TaxID=1855727 RepID=UPI00097E634F|nr:Atxe2 family lasso peptide isopeptidase [Sphingopyxis sp. KK2]